MAPRATPLAAEERRAHLVDATLPLLLEHGRGVTTRQIARAAGVAEGTIFRVFDSKDDLVLAAVEQGLDMGKFITDLGSVELDQDLRSRLLELATRLQARFASIFALMTVMGMSGPPRAHRHTAEDRRTADKIMVALVEPDADRITCPPEQLVHLLRTLTFAATHPHLSDGQPLSAEQIVAVLLDGVLKEGH